VRIRSFGKVGIKFNLLEVAKLWQKGTLVSGLCWIGWLTVNAELEFGKYGGPIAESGEATLDS